MLSRLQGGGLPLRGPIRAIYSYPTIVIFCEGLGIAAARALIEAEPAVGSLSFPLRQDVRLYYRVSCLLRICISHSISPEHLEHHT